MGKKVLVIGGGIDGIQAALDLADSQLEVTLVERSLALAPGSPGGYPTKTSEALLLAPKLLRAFNHPHIRLLTGTMALQVKEEKHRFKAAVIKSPEYVSVGVCASCGRCERECPVEIIPYPDGARRHKAIHDRGFGPKSVPSAYTIDKMGTAPCTAACPAGVNAHGFVALISKGKFSEALDLITDAVPFPRVLGRVCSHPCQKECTRARIDNAVSICALKRFVADNNSTHSSLVRAQSRNGIVKLSDAPQVAIIGAGPAGLTAARELARMGHRSVVFEALSVPGGMITVGMPRFRLPREVRQADIEDIVRLGIEIRTSMAVGKDLTLNDLRRDYRAVLIATGAHKNQRLGIAGEHLSGVIDSIALLQALNLKQPITVGSRVVVIGGGYTAIDSARTAIRLHCQKVLILYRRSLDEMPANAEEVAEAQEEGVEIQYLAGPVRIVGREGRVTGVECIRMGLGEPDSSGRRRPIPLPGSEFFVEADSVIVAVGQRPDLSFLGGDTTLTEGRNHVIIDRLTMATRVPGVFAAGDVAGETGTLIEAIAAGRRAAASIDRFLRGEEFKHERSSRIPIAVDASKVFVPPVEHQRMPCLPLQDRVCNFEEVGLGLTAEMALREAKRCLNCGGCSECRECERVCELKAVQHGAVPQDFDLEADAVIADPESIGEARSSAIAERPGFYVIASGNGDFSRASAVASQVLVDLSKPGRGNNVRQRSEPGKVHEPFVGTAIHKEPRLGVFVCGCGGNISGVINIPEIIQHCNRQGIAYGGQIDYACTDESAVKIKALVRQHGLTHVVLAACACCNLDQICFSCSDRRIRCKSNLLDDGSGVYYEFVNIREHCAWVHGGQPGEATAKAKGLVQAALARAREGRSLPVILHNIERNVLIVGRGLGGMRAAADLSAQGFLVILVNGQNSAQAFEKSRLRQRLERELEKHGVGMLSGVRLKGINSTTGGYRAMVDQDGSLGTFEAGAVILDLSPGNSGNNGGVESPPDLAGLPEMLVRALGERNSNQPGMLEPVLSRLPGVFICGTGPAAKNPGEALIQGSAAAAKVSALLNKGYLKVEQALVAVDSRRCRGCGTCASVCPVGAIALEENAGSLTARLNEWLCRGCGICLTHCPTGALSQDACRDSQIVASLEEILL